MPKQIHEFAQQADGTRLRQVEWSEGVKVLVQAGSREADEEAAITTAVIAGLEEALSGAEAGIAAMAEELKKTRALIPPKRPTRLLGHGVVRFSPETREVWLLGSREKGWASFGYAFNSWDALFRAFDVQITAHGVDEHGPWWQAENTRA